MSDAFPETQKPHHRDPPPPLSPGLLQFNLVATLWLHCHYFVTRLHLKNSHGFKPPNSMTPRLPLKPV